MLDVENPFWSSWSVSRYCRTQDSRLSAPTHVRKVQLQCVIYGRGNHWDHWRPPDFIILFHIIATDPAMSLNLFRSVWGCSQLIFTAKGPQWELGPVSQLFACLPAPPDGNSEGNDRGTHFIYSSWQKTLSTGVSSCVQTYSSLEWARLS